MARLQEKIADWQVEHDLVGSFPIEGVLDLRHLASRWESGPIGDPIFDMLQSQVIKKINDLKTKHGEPGWVEALSSPDVLRLLLADRLSQKAWEEDYWGIMVPLSRRKVACTSKFRDVKLTGIDRKLIAEHLMVLSYQIILKQLYGFHFDFDYQRIISPGYDLDGAEKAFELKFDFQYCRAEPVGDVVEFSQASKKTLMENLNDVNVWMRILPCQSFRIRGIVLMQLIDVSYRETLGDITKALVGRDSILERKKFERLQGLIRKLMGQQDLSIGLTSFSRQPGLDQRIVRYSSPMIATHRSYRFLNLKVYKNSILGKCLAINNPFVAYDCQFDDVSRESLDWEFLQGGIRNLVVLPLRFEDQLIGYLDIGSKKPGTLTYLNIGKLEALIPLFVSVLRRSSDQIENRIQTIVQAHCTAIHPSIDWSFREAALESLAQSESGEPRQMRDIVFKNVFPLYGASDIRSSSNLRNSAILKDMSLQLELATRVLEPEMVDHPLPVLERLYSRITAFADQLKGGLKAGDELAVLQFLQGDVERVFSEPQLFGQVARTRLGEYQKALDANLRFVYRERRAFEEKVNFLNSRICQFMDREQNSAQRAFPHYFEKHATDGVDHSIFIGESLTRSRKFTDVHLENLRLWQLKLMCGIAALAEKSRGEGGAALELAHMVAVQENPISIRFDYGEKKFLVAGAYDVRYEIIKSRLDKARVKRTNERVTQPGCLSIVYSHSRERLMYINYLTFLTESGYFQPGVEDLELEDLQGVEGIRALRVQIDLATSATLLFSADNEGKVVSFALNHRT